MQHISLVRMVAGLLFLGVCMAGASAEAASASEPVAMAQTTSSISSKAFLGTPAPVVVTAPSSPSVGTTSAATLAPVRTGLVNPLVGAVILIVVLLAAGALIWRRRRTMPA